VAPCCTVTELDERVREKSSAGGGAVCLCTLWEVAPWPQPTQPASNIPRTDFGTLCRNRPKE
jgi:hypothetical protein